MAGCLFVTPEMDGVNLSVSWLQSKFVQEILFLVHMQANL
jgi:hypothetical protein